MVKVEISTAIWYCGLWQFYVCKEHLKSRPGSVTYRYQQKTKKTKIKMVFFNTLLLIFVDVGWVARHIIAITPEKWWNQYRRKITSLRFKFFNWKFLFRIAWKHFPIKTKDTAAAETEKTEPHDYADYGYARKLLFIELSPIKWPAFKLCQKLFILLPCGATFFFLSLDFYIKYLILIKTNCP